MLTTIAFLPQVIKTWKSRSAKDLSLGMFSLFCTGVALWLAYGFLVRDIPVHRGLTCYLDAGFYALVFQTPV
jgi:MtN3 and saliva related transmembrane protein